MTYFNAFWVGGLLCAIAQVLIDKTTLTPARILVLYVCLGVFLTAFGIYTPIVEYACAGATVHIMGFGYSLCNGVKKAVMKQGLLGIFTGGVTATAAGITAAVLFGYIYALIFKPKEK